MGQLIVLIVLLSIGYFTGAYLEKRHYDSIREREKNLVHISTTNFKKPIETSREVLKSQMAVGSVVVSADYFKTFFANLKNIFGGSISSYESLIDRGRREAILRMKEQFSDYDDFINLRVETSSISKGKAKSVVTVEVLAYSTAIKYV